MNTQVNIILANYLDKPKGITSAEAMRLYSIGRLASRINDIKKLGYIVITVQEVGLNQFGQRTRYVRYFIRSK